ncbi:MAG: hypothetical protein WDW36_002353 [Sanguina aurantia]
MLLAAVVLQRVWWVLRKRLASHNNNASEDEEEEEEGQAAGMRLIPDMLRSALPKRRHKNLAQRVAAIHSAKQAKAASKRSARLLANPEPPAHTLGTGMLAQSNFAELSQLNAAIHAVQGEQLSQASSSAANAGSSSDAPAGSTSDRRLSTSALHPASAAKAQTSQQLIDLLKSESNTRGVPSHIGPDGSLSSPALPLPVSLARHPAAAANLLSKPASLSQSKGGHNSSGSTSRGLLTLVPARQTSTAAAENLIGASAGSSGGLPLLTAAAQAPLAGDVSHQGAAAVPVQESAAAAAANSASAESPEQDPDPLPVMKRIVRTRGPAVVVASSVVPAGGAS